MVTFDHCGVSCRLGVYNGGYPDASGVDSEEMLCGGVGVDCSGNKGTID